MPKEIIFQKTPAGDPATRESVVRVGWSRVGQGEYVELATVNPITQEPLDPLTMGGDAYGWFVQLDRDEINRLIRVLRKARDQAFGADA